MTPLEESICIKKKKAPVSIKHTHTHWNNCSWPCILPLCNPIFTPPGWPYLSTLLYSHVLQRIKKKAQAVNCLPAMQETQETGVWSLGREDALEEEMATHSSILTWKSHGQMSLVGYGPWGCKETRVKWLSMCMHTTHTCGWFTLLHSRN